MEQNLTWESILAIFGGVVIIGQGIKMIVSAFSPFRKLDKKVDEHEKKLSEHDSFFCNDKDAIERLTEVCDDNRKMQIAMLNHTIDGNGIESMKKLRDKIQQKM